MRNENKSYITVYVNNETRDKFREIMKESGYKGDMFINVLLKLYSQNQQKEENGGKEK